MTRQERVFAARWIIPITRDPICGGWLRVHDGRVVEIGTAAAPAEALQLGDVAILPGLINAHTHLEFSDFRKPIGDQGIPLHHWIRKVVASRRERTAKISRQSIARGLRELAETGTRMAGEITTPPCDYPAEVARPELVTFAEVLGLQRERANERLAAAADHISIHGHGGLSPHAPYSTSLETIDRCVELAKSHDRPIAMHVAESPAERELLSNGTGPLADMLGSLGAWSDDAFPWGDDPFGMLIERLSHAPRALLIHGNDLSDLEIERLRRHNQMTVVYCPRTHLHFRYPKHPVDRMLAAGLRVALGTDSRASNPDLNLWHEVQFLLQHRPDLSPLDVLRMATVLGADAFGRDDLGRIEVGCCGEFGIVPTHAQTLRQLYEDLSRNAYASLGALHST